MGLIRDIFGRLISATPPERRLRRRIVSAGVRDRQDMTGVLSNVTPAKLISIFTEADNGNTRGQVELAQTIRERDDHVACVDQIRRSAVLAVDLQIEPGGNSSEERMAAEAFSEAWESLDHHSIRGRLMEAVLDQWHVEEVLWDTDGRLAGRQHWRPIRVEEVDARKLAWPYTCTSDPGDITGIIPGVMRDWNPTDLIPLEPGKFLWLSHRAKRGRPGKGALVRCLAALWMFKRFSFIDLSQLIEQWGRPWPLLKYDSSRTPEEVQGWLETLADTMADRILAVPIGSEAEVQPAGASGADTPHINLIRLCNEGISKVFVGSTTIAEAAANNDSVSSPTHASVRLDIRNADAIAMAAAIRETLAVPYTLWNFGPDVAPPMIRPNLAIKPDPESRGRVFLQAQSLGLTVQSDQLYSELALDKPADVPETIKLEPAAAAGGLGANPLAHFFGGGASQGGNDAAE